ncbi:hypothetical protein F5Y17DRAFT_43051 [Xylariaceae sp. FL0594]|nr:hypothetical protein F5Y17DRAFT_43051 [Xylariaceae sp. FL0594]
MFATFSGSSRRPRHVDLSGQRNLNPWSNSNRGPIQSGASKTVAQAQAERERRQREREELAATKRLQRVWRGHRDRRRLRSIWRREYDLLYQQPISAQDRRLRIRRALPLFLASFAPGSSDDQQRMDLFLADLLSLSSTSGPTLDISALGQYDWDRLARLIVVALDKRTESSPETLLITLTQIITQRPGAVTPVLKTYYGALARMAQSTSPAGPPDIQDKILCDAIVAPLLSNPGEGTSRLDVYGTFAYSFLASSNLGLLERDPKLVTQVLDLATLSESIIAAFSDVDVLGSMRKDDLLWLLAHFVAMNRAVPTAGASRYLEALYLLMSYLSIDIRSRSHPPQDKDGDYDSDTGEDAQMQDYTPMPEYVAEQLEFLVNDDGIMDLLKKFDSNASAAGHVSEMTSLLAGYTLVLLQCFPTHGDDIKMRFFQGDIQTSEGPLPSVKYFWKAAAKTGVFTTVAQQIDARDKLNTVAALLLPDPVHDLEWRTILLFLELYNFLLRVTDDEDFLPRETEIYTRQSQAAIRIRNSGLALGELRLLVSFLKNLAFQLFYNLPDITNQMSAASRTSRLDTETGADSSRVKTQDTRDGMPPFAGIIGMSILGLRDVASSAMRALYERDSRRPFLPKDFWLMTSNFDMAMFISAVVAEEIRNIEILESDDEGEAGEEGHWRRAAERLRSATGPKLEVLRNMPFAIPFEVRVQIFRQFVHLDQAQRRGGYIDPDRWRIAIMTGEQVPAGLRDQRRQYLGRHTAIVGRGRVFDDAYDQFYPLGEGLKEPIQITFVDQFQQQEAGIDGGGVTKEFLISATNDAFSPERIDNRVYFVSNNQNLLYPNPSIFDDVAAEMRSYGVVEGSVEWRTTLNDILKRYEFLGRIVGKCMYEGILIDISFASFFLLKWASSGQSSTTDYRANLNDLRDLDPELYKGLMDLKNYPGDVADLSLDFTIADSVRDASGQRRNIIRPLRKDGANIPVTNKDRPLYISYVANHRLVAQQYRQTKAFLRGLGTIINPSWLSMFNQSELQRLIGGDSSEIDIEDLRQNTTYSGLYEIGDDGLEHPTIVYFWEVMRELKDSERREVLKYVTSTPRAPLLGFSQLKPGFTIRDGGTDQERLPSTSTCVNLLKLPVYQTAATLKAKLLYAVQSGAGFDLS